jgi:hypothetical protein
MQNFQAAAAPYAQDLWAQVVASAALDEALDALNDAAATLEALIDETDWQVLAGRLLNASLIERRGRVAAQSATVFEHRDLVNRVPAW